MKYFLVTCKCGHVGLGKSVYKTFPITAHDKKEAANIARQKGRVKHHDKHAIKEVIEISHEENLEQVKIHESDEFFNVHSVQEQRARCPEIYDQVVIEEEKTIYRKSREKRHLVDKARVKEITKYKSYLNYE